MQRKKRNDQNKRRRAAEGERMLDGLKEDVVLSATEQGTCAVDAHRRRGH